MFAAKHFDMVIGVDIHINLIPAPTPIPTPIPHPYVGMILDLPDYLPFIGQDVEINGMKAAQPMTEVVDVPPHFPMAGPFPKPPESKGEIFTGSSTVGTAAPTLAEMAKMFSALAMTKLGITPPFEVTPPSKIHPLSRLGDITLGCADVGSPAPTSKDKKGGVSGLTVPMGVVMAVPKGFPVLVGGPPGIAPPSAWAMRFAMQFAMKKLVKLFKKGATLFNHKVLKKLSKEGNLAEAASNKMCKWGLEPIDLSSGKQSTERDDFSLAGPIPLAWNSVYYSSSYYDGPAGYGWHHSYDISLTAEVKEGHAVIKMRMADGRVAFFPQLEIGDSHFDRQEKIELFRDERGYGFRDEYLLQYRFHENKGAQWPLARIEDSSGNTIVFEYENNGALARITDSVGRKLKVDTNPEGRILVIHAPHPDEKGKTFPIIQYEYDKIGNLTAAIDALGHPFKYHYEGHLMMQLTFRDGLSFYYEYDGTDHTAKCIHSHGDGGLYNGNIAYEKGKTTLERIVAQPDGSINKTYETIYHDGAVALRVIDTLGNEEQFEYSEDYDLLAKIDKLGNRTEYEYDERGNLTETKLPDETQFKMAYNEHDQLESATNQIGAQWHWLYDSNQRLIRNIDALERSTIYNYNENGLPSFVVDAAGGKTILGTDRDKNLDQVTTPDNASSRWEYDELGRIIKSVDPKGNIRKFAYNLLGQVIKLNEPDGNIIHLKYDKRGNLIHFKDKQRDIEMKYWGMRTMHSRTENDTKVEFQYTSQEDLVAITNEHGSVYRFMLDNEGQVIQESGFDGLSRTYQRDAAGRVELLTKASGEKTSYEYDDLGRLIGLFHSNGKTDTFSYREDGALMKATNEHGFVQFERDILGRVIQENQNGFTIDSEYNVLDFRTRLQSSLGADLIINRNQMGDVLGMRAETADRPWEVQFTRDIMGLELERLMAGGIKGVWDRDRLGRPIKHEVSGKNKETHRDRQYVWDSNHRLKSYVDFGKEITTFEYDEVGNLASATLPNGKTENKLPDAVGNLFKKNDQSDRKYGPAGQLLEAEGTKYEYDPEGNLTHKYSPEGEHWHYQWNVTGMLAKVIRPDETEVSFTYDALGRRLSKTYLGKTTRWVWDGNVPLHEWQEDSDRPYKAPTESLPNIGKENFSPYDETDILIEEVGSSYSSSSSDFEILIEEVGQSDVAVMPPKVATLTAKKQQGPIPAHTITWLFEPDSFVPIAKLIDGKQYNIQTDHLGTPISMFDEQGQKIWAADIDIYGNISSFTGDKAACPFRYQGQYEDVETELYYNRFRYYSVESGAYISQDPIGLDSREYNLYTYVSDANSILDPFGLDWNYVLVDSNGKAYYHGRASDNQSMKDVARRHSKTKGTDGARFGEGDRMKRITDVGTDPDAVRGVEQRGVAENDLLGRGSDKARGNKINGISEAKQGKVKGRNRLSLADELLDGIKPSKKPSLDELNFKDLKCK